MDGVVPGRRETVPGTPSWRRARFLASPLGVGIGFRVLHSPSRVELSRGLQLASKPPARDPPPPPLSLQMILLPPPPLCPGPAHGPAPHLQQPLWPPALSFTSSNPSSSRLSGPRVICLKRKIDHLLSHLKLALAPQCPSVLAGIQDLLKLAVLMYHSLPLEPAVSSPLSVPNRQARHVGHETAVRGQPSVAAHHAAMGLPGCPLLLCGPDLHTAGTGSAPPTPRDAAATGPRLWFPQAPMESGLSGSTTLSRSPEGLTLGAVPWREPPFHLTSCCWALVCLREPRVVPILCFSPPNSLYLGNTSGTVPDYHPQGGCRPSPTFSCAPNSAKATGFGALCPTSMPRFPFGVLRGGQLCRGGGAEG